MRQTAFLLKSLVVVAMMGWAALSHAQGYEVERGRVYFGGEALMEADASLDRFFETGESDELLSAGNNSSCNNHSLYFHESLCSKDALANGRNHTEGID